MSDRNPHLAPVPGDRWRDEITGSVREVCDVRQRSNSGKGPILVYFWTGRDWQGKKYYKKVKVRNAETGELEKKDVFVHQPTAKTSVRCKRVTLKLWTQWTLGLGRKYAGLADKTTKPGRVTFAMEPAHKISTKAAKEAATKRWLIAENARRVAAKAAKEAEEKGATK